MDMINRRNQTSHTYNETIANELASAILENYPDEFKLLQQKLQLLNSNKPSE